MFVSIQSVLKWTKGRRDETNPGTNAGEVVDTTGRSGAPTHRRQVLSSLPLPHPPGFMLAVLILALVSQLWNIRRWRCGTAAPRPPVNEPQLRGCYQQVAVQGHTNACTVHRKCWGGAGGGTGSSLGCFSFIFHPRKRQTFGEATAGTHLQGHHAVAAWTGRPCSFYDGRT